jgi:prepilin-type processing-associated H-X9-DG protein
VPLTGADSCFLRRLAARHGKKTANGLNAWTNLAFFDGHVSSYRTDTFQQNATVTDNNAPDRHQETIFYIHQQGPRTWPLGP